MYIQNPKISNKYNISIDSRQTLLKHVRFTHINYFYIILRNQKSTLYYISKNICSRFEIHKMAKVIISSGTKELHFTNFYFGNMPYSYKNEGESQSPVREVYFFILYYIRLLSQQGI